jgi:hypothetical protein
MSEKCHLWTAPDLNGETNSLKRKKSSATIVVDVT